MRLIEYCVFVVNFNIKIGMQKYIESNMKDQVKHIINLQYLLSQYDRENKHLNEQILQLLTENKELKISKIRNSIFDRNTKVFQKGHPFRAQNRELANYAKPGRKNKYPQQLANLKKKTVKDELLSSGVTNMEVGRQKGLITAKAEEKQNSISKEPYLQEKDFDTFSFRGEAKTEENSKILTESIQNMDDRQTNKKGRNQDSNLAKTIDLDKETVHTVQLSNSKLAVSFQRTQAKSQIAKQAALKQASRNGRKMNKSHHAIKPSPHITACQSEKSLFRDASLKSKNAVKVEGLIQQKYHCDGEKRKTFISMTSIKPTRFHLRTEGCC